MDYEGNPDKGKEIFNKPPAKPEKQIEMVVTGEVIQKPKGLGRKFKDVFFGGDLKTAARYAAADVIFPALRNLLVDTVSKGAERLVFGESTYRRRPVEYRSRIQYNSPPLRDPRDPRSYPSRGLLPDQPHPNRVMRRESNDVIFAQKEDAERVLEQMIDIIDQYQVVSWADLCAMCEWDSSPIDNKWGWTYLTNVQIRQTRDGYLIDLPALEAI